MAGREPARVCDVLGGSEGERRRSFRPRKELRAVQQRTNKPKPKTAETLALLRATRKQAVRDGVSAQLVAAIDQAIRVGENDLVVETAGLHFLDEGIRRLTDFSHRNSILS